MQKAADSSKEKLPCALFTDDFPRQVTFPQQYLLPQDVQMAAGSEGFERMIGQISGGEFCESKALYNILSKQP